MFGMTVTWGVSMLAGRVVARQQTTRWMASRAGAIGWALLAGGLALALYAFSQGMAGAGASLVLLGSLLAMAGLWLITTAP